MYNVVKKQPTPNAKNKTPRRSPTTYRKVTNTDWEKLGLIKKKDCDNYYAYKRNKCDKPINLTFFIHWAESPDNRSR